MPPLKAIVFDLDGTLVDSARDLQDAVNVLLQEEGLRPISLGEAKGMIGDGAAKLVERAVTAAGGDVGRLQDLVPRFLAIYEDRASAQTEAYPGVREVLRHLVGKGLKLALVTNKPVSATLTILDALRLKGYFGAVVGGDTLPQRKPDPAPLRLALSRLGVEPGEALMVGDNYHDIQAARAAGLGAYAVTYGYSHKPHAELGADGLFEAMTDLIPVVEALLGASAVGGDPR